MNNIKVNNKALLPIVIALAGFMMTPDFYNLLPDKAAHVIAGIAMIASTLLPQLFSKDSKDKE